MESDSLLRSASHADFRSQADPAEEIQFLASCLVFFLQFVCFCSLIFEDVFILF